MTYKSTSIITLTLIIIAGLFYLKSSKGFSQLSDNVYHDPGFFPSILAIALIILCIISIIQNILRKDVVKVSVPNIKLILLTIVMAVLFIVTWSIIGYFYILNFLFLLILFTIYRYDRVNLKKIIINNVLIALGTTLVVYIIFDLIISVKF